MSDLNHYLRRADVEALLDGKIEALDTTIACQVNIIGGRASGDRTIHEARVAQSIKSDAIARKEAIETVKAQLGLCQQFSYRSFREYDGPGTEYHALVDMAADRVPLIPIKTEALAA